MAKAPKPTAANESPQAAIDVARLSPLAVAPLANLAYAEEAPALTLAMYCE